MREIPVSCPLFLFFSVLFSARPFSLPNIGLGSRLHLPGRTFGRALLCSRPRAFPFRFVFARYVRTVFLALSSCKARAKTRSTRRNCERGATRRCVVCCCACCARCCSKASLGRQARRTQDLETSSQNIDTCGQEGTPRYRCEWGEEGERYRYRGGVEGEAGERGKTGIEDPLLSVDQRHERATDEGGRFPREASTPSRFSLSFRPIATSSTPGDGEDARSVVHGVGGAWCAARACRCFQCQLVTSQDLQEKLGVGNVPTCRPWTAWVDPRRTSHPSTPHPHDYPIDHALHRRVRRGSGLPARGRDLRESGYEPGVVSVSNPRSPGLIGFDLPIKGGWETRGPKRGGDRGGQKRSTTGARAHHHDDLDAPNEEHGRQEREETVVEQVQVQSNQGLGRRSVDGIASVGPTRQALG